MESHLKAEPGEPSVSTEPGDVLRHTYRPRGLWNERPTWRGWQPLLASAARTFQAGRAWLPGAGALVAVGAMIVLQGDETIMPLNAGSGLLVAGAIVAARAFQARRRIIAAWLLADAAATTGLVLLTGSWFSPFYLLLIAGIWWAAHGSGRWSALLYTATFVVIYGSVALGASLASDRLQEAVEDVGLALVIAVLADLYLRIDGRAMALTDALADIRNAGHSATLLHERLRAAVRDVVLPVDSLLAGGQMGLKAQETELLGLLMLGLTNQQLADTLHVSEATVKFRLTSLYRRLGVRGRAQAITRGHRLGLALAPDEVEAISGDLYRTGAG